MRGRVRQYENPFGRACVRGCVRFFMQRFFAYFQAHIPTYFFAFCSCGTGLHIEPGEYHG